MFENIHFRVRSVEESKKVSSNIHHNDRKYFTIIIKIDSFCLNELLLYNIYIKFSFLKMMMTAA